MDPAAVAGVLLVAVAVVLVWTGAGAATSMIGGLFSHPDLGWPAGVQEDDEARWDWAVRRREEAAEPAEAPSPTPTSERLVPTLRRGSTR
jgi:hypothetical protein